MRVTDPVAIAVGQRVRDEMAKNHIRQPAVARRLGLSQGAVSRRLQGQVPLNVTELAAIGRFLDVPLTAFLEPLDIAA